MATYTFTENQSTKANTVRTKLYLVKDALDALQSPTDDLMNLFYAKTGTDAAAAASYKAGNAVYKFKALVKRLRADLDEGHALVSNAALEYDPVAGLQLARGGTTEGGGGGRG